MNVKIYLDINDQYFKEVLMEIFGKDNHFNEEDGFDCVANAILDRILHHSHVININGRSYRIKDKIPMIEDSDA